MKKEGLRAKKMTISNKSFLTVKRDSTLLRIKELTSPHQGRTRPHGRQSQHDCLEKIIKVGTKLSLHLWSHTRTSRSVAASWASPGTQGASSWWTSQGEPVRIHRWQPVVFDDVHLDFWEVAALVAHKLGSGEHFFQSVKDIRPKEVSAKIIKVFAVGDDPLERLNLLFHRSAMVVDLVQHINYSSTEEDCGVVKVVHETEKFAFSPVQPFNCYFPPVYCQTKLSHAKGSVFLRLRHWVPQSWRFGRITFKCKA